MLRGQLAGHIINHPLLKPSERLVLSLYYGVFSSELDGVTLDTKKAATRFLYTKALHKNPFFCEGLTVGAISDIIGLSDSQVDRILAASLEKARDIALTKVYTDIDRELFGHASEYRHKE